MRNSTIYHNIPKTFRRSSRSILGKWGGNLQNIEKGLREVYIPDGYNESLKARCKYYLETGDTSVFTEEELLTLRIFLQVDQSGAEALIVAYDSDAGDYRQLFINGVKPHVYVAMKLFKDIWKEKAREHNTVVTGADVITLCDTKIPDLKKNAAWKTLDNLIKMSDDWSYDQRYYYFAKQTVHCMDKETEALTPKGWVSLETLAFGDNLTPIAIFNGSIIKFEIPQSWYKQDYIGDMCKFVGDEVDQLVTPDHKVVYESNGKHNLGFAKDVLFHSRLNIPTGGYYSGGDLDLPDWQIKLLVAIQADGQFIENNCVRFKFAKDRKIDRLINICKEGDISYRWHDWVGRTTADNPVSSIVVEGLVDTLKYFNGVKRWDSWLLRFSLKNLMTLIEELKYWDGSFTSTYRHKREYYCSSIKQNIDWIKTICHLVEMQGTINIEHDNVYKLGLNGRRCSIAKNKSLIKDWKGWVFCPTVSTGMFLVRRNEKISITHNSGNYDIQAPMFRSNVLEKSGGKVVLSPEDSVYFLQCYRGLFPEIPERNERVRRQVDKTKMLFNLFGFPYTITNYNITEATYKEYYAWGPQSTVGEITRIAFTNLQTYIEEAHKQWDILADTHDSYLVQCPLLDVKECMSKMQECMNQELISPIDGVKFNMRSECKCGFNWGSYKKEKNELGLRELQWI